MKTNSDIGPTPDIDPDEEWAVPVENQDRAPYNCFEDTGFLEGLPKLLRESERRFKERRRSLEQAERITYIDLQTFVGSAAA